MKRLLPRLVVLAWITLPTAVLAQGGGGPPPIAEPNALGSQLQKAGKSAGFATEGGGADITVIVGKIVQGALTLMGSLFLAQTVYGGYLWMTARGDEQQVEKAKHTLRTSTIGLGIMLAAYAITTFVINRLTTATLG